MECAHGYGPDWSASRVPVLLRTVEDERARSGDQHRVARVLPSLLSGLPAYAAAKTAVPFTHTRVSRCEWANDWYFRECHRARSISHRTEQSNSSWELHGETRCSLRNADWSLWNSPKNWSALPFCWRSNGASFITGQVIAVDGGYLASGVNQ
jgi:NAD(P)-dependent dehydrogenase (short-subunit alcohol dehydrogenase family)